MLNDVQFLEEVDGAEIQAAPGFCYSAAMPPKAPKASKSGGLSGQAVIKTLTGEKQVCDLKPGDQVLTRDNGFQAVRWVGRLGSGQGVETMMKVKANAFAAGLPSADLLLSPQQRLLTSCDALRALSDGAEALVRARDLGQVDKGVFVEVRAECWHILLGRHEVILANDLWTESFQPDWRFVESAEKSVQRQMARLCPALGRSGSQRAFPAARSQTRLCASA